MIASLLIFNERISQGFSPCIELSSLLLMKQVIKCIISSDQHIFIFYQYLSKIYIDEK